MAAPASSVAQPRAWAPSGFMAAARQAPPPAGCVALLIYGRCVRHKPSTTAGRMCERKRTVTSGRSTPSGPASKVPADLVGLCFNCFNSSHLTKRCPNPYFCFCCPKPGHQAQDCLLPRVPHAGCQCRGGGPTPDLSATRPLSPSRVPSLTLPRSQPSSPRDLMRPGTSCSTDGGLGTSPSISGPPPAMSPHLRDCPPWRPRPWLIQRPSRAAERNPGCRSW
jgi:hypothetical protein